MDLKGTQSAWPLHLPKVGEPYSCPLPHATPDPSAPPKRRGVAFSNSRFPPPPSATFSSTPTSGRVTGAESAAREGSSDAVGWGSGRSRRVGGWRARSTVRSREGASAGQEPARWRWCPRLHSGGSRGARSRSELS